MKTVKLGDNTVGGGKACYIVAEIGGNFATIEQGKVLIDLASKAGVNAVKLQTFRADTITSKKAMFYMENTGVASQYEHFKKYELDKSMHKLMFEYAAYQGLLAFSTPSHPTDIDLLEELDVPAYKIGSDDAVNIPFLKYAAQTGKPILLSTGMCTLTEVQRAIDAILEEDNDQIILFHCTSNYPTHPESVNLMAMVTMMNHFGFPVGYSDHTLGIDTCYAAGVLGASILEFHFTHDKKAKGPDHMLSKDELETSELVKKIRDIPVLLGDGIKRPAADEMTSRKNNRKSLIVKKNIPRGEKISPLNVEIKRPGYGIPCEHYYSILGKTATRDLKADDPLEWDDIL